MAPITISKLVIAAGALVLFAAGVRVDMPALRWAAVSLLVVAFLLRFYNPPS